eukprot:CAMPEP_0201514678 /NCGR_PEP_ID=MMETSP0161_2-20130828/6454_1 /ASSEMBLY_ACC=CAM_ASM_000251 /TAXON_ID=180227 /ORGANISM="Neoparamoeba aestuarina, Strain SoJaBio B1-5/56/2" /LENGTH=538 /DNA_ID=CAMNT_0047911303 /DNA_START=102 /DNA_END=1718 /DNA_ORIENTATION=+
MSAPAICSSCGDKFAETTAKAPILLQCGHSFCRLCVFDRLEGANVVCGKLGCNGRTPLPSGGVDNLAVSFDLLKIGGKDDLLPPAEQPSKSTLKTLCDQATWDENLRDLQAGNHEKVLQAAIRTRQRLSLIESPLEIADKTVEMGFLEHLIPLLAHSDKKLAFEAAWCISNVASGSAEATEAVCDAGGIAAFLDLMRKGPRECTEQAVWGLGNIVGTPGLYERCVNEGALDVLFQQFGLFSSSTPSFLRTAVWALSNFGRNMGGPEQIPDLEPFFPLCAAFLDSNDEEVQSDTCWFLSYVADKDGEPITRHGLIPKLVNLMKQKLHTSVATPCWRALGTLSSGSDTDTQIALDCGLLDVAIEILKDEELQKKKKQLLKETCWVISNVAAGTDNQRKRLIDAKIYPELDRVVRTCGHDSTINETMWCFVNMCQLAATDTLLALMEQVKLAELCIFVLEKKWVGRQTSLALFSLRYVFDRERKLPPEEEGNFFSDLSYVGGIEVIRGLDTSEFGDDDKESRTLLLEKAEELFPSADYVKG